jgi:hypothetical protein
MKTQNKKANTMIWIIAAIIVVIILVGIYLVLFNKKTISTEEDELNDNSNAINPIETNWCTLGTIVENLNFSVLSGVPVRVIERIPSNTNPICHVKTNEEQEYYVSIDMKNIFKVDYVNGQKKINQI